MALNQIQRPSLGQWADLGALYDARTDSFIPISLLSGPAPLHTIATSPAPFRQAQYLDNDSYKVKLNNLKVGAEVGSSFLAGMLDIGGVAEYLKDQRLSDLSEQASIYYTVTTIEERLAFASPDLKTILSLEPIRGSGATHVLACIVWGAQSIITLKHQLIKESESQRDQAKRQFNEVFRRVEYAISSGASVDTGFRDMKTDRLDFAITVYSDVLPEPGHTTDLKQAVDFIIELPHKAAEIHGGKGMPLTYTLVPLETLLSMLGSNVRADAICKQPNFNTLEDFQALFDEVHDSMRRLYDYHQLLTHEMHSVPPDFISTVSQSLQSLTAAESSLRSMYRQLLEDIRSGRAHQTQLTQSLDVARRSFASAKDISDVTSKFHEKIAFVNRAMASGINFLGYGASTIEAELVKHGIEDAYALFFNEQLRQNSSTWDQNYRLLLQLQKDGPPDRVVAIVDCEAFGILLHCERISRFQRYNVVVPDVLDQIINGQCFARYIDETQLDKSDAQKPLRRSAVKIACPGRRCDKGFAHDWVCSKCQVPIEYSPVDQHIYCDCGRSVFHNYGFKCKELEHGKPFERYSKSTLLQLLDSLDPLDELNILIIGETGVGKSTFINAFVNYLTYDTLDDAMKSNHLDSVIPCSFMVQSMDRSDPSGAITQQRIRVGDDKEEADGSAGASATQSTTVYPITYNDTVVRLIDTPGIGDTRGYDMDKENMANILNTLRYFDKLHGILFLLKSNSPRLTLMFRFVVEELLTHLHRDAALNMVFGFTNTRISNYMPGDTYEPLKTLLAKHQRVDIELSTRTVYCFDSESFRFLAARKNNVEMENIQDFRLSWDKSEKETKRLVEHFRSLEPHFVRSTLSLNQTRELILQLTRPMADIMQQIDSTIQLNVDNIADLQDTKLRGDKLRGRLKWEKKEVETRPLDKPRTVCNDLKCKDFEDDGSGHKQPIYKSLCHKICHLQKVPPETLMCPEMKNCAAFGGKEECQECGHRWENHLHILYELTEVLKEVDDEAVVKLLAKNADDIVLKEAAIENLKKRIAEADYEYKEIQDAAVRFGLFLKKNSITAYNDAMLAYLDHLINDEVDKVNVGGNRERLDNLLKHRREHVEQVKVLSHNMEGGQNEELLDETGVEALVNHLYRLKHWGKNLLDNKTKAEAAHEQARYRERPFRPQGRGGGSHRSYGGQGSSSTSSFLGAVSSAVNYFTGNTHQPALVAEMPRRPYVNPHARAIQPARSGRAPPSVPVTYAPSGSTMITSTDSRGRLLRKPARIVPSQPSRRASGNSIVTQAYVPPIYIPPELPIKPDSLKSKLLRPFSKRY